MGRQVIKTEEGEYITIPDGDKATKEEICEYERMIKDVKHHE
jgi:hypothetical protein